MSRHHRIAILWTIVIVFISQLFHCAYTNERDQQQQHHQPAPANREREREWARAHADQHAALRQALYGYGRQEPSEEPARATYEDLLEPAAQQQQQQRQQSARERCRELISLTLLSFRDLSPDERASEEIDCANLREQIAAAAGRHRARPAPLEPAEPAQQPADEFPLAPVYQSVTRPAPSRPDNSSASGWSPKSQSASLALHQMHQLLLQQRQQQQLYLAGTTTQPSTYEPESTPPPTTASISTTSTSTTSTTSTPRLRLGAGRRRQGNGRQLRASSTTSTSTTTTSTTTPRPSTLADYADGAELATDYYDEYDDAAQTTTTTTTTARPHRRSGGRKPKRQRPAAASTSTSPRPTTSSTTLSPGYQPRPDGRIIDYLADPNFPRELKGADLTNYPFYISVPDKIDFECKGRHDGYYANIDLHCQIYHHCAVGNRYDFLCPNYTLFDQTTFTCRFINTVDCDGSAKHFDRNNALYVEKDDKEAPASTAASTSTSTTTTTQSPKSRATGSGAGSQSTGRLSGPISALVVMQQQQSRAAPTGGASNPRSRRSTADT